jgi:hypothetical protein
MRNLRLIATFGAIALAACREATVGPATQQAPAFAVTGVAACPTPANFVVSDEAGLLAALAAASPGQVIAVSGTIAVTADVSITTPGITLTCASPGAGLTAQGGVVDMLNALANGVTVERLVLDASNVDGPYQAGFVAGVRLTNNRVICGLGVCAFFQGTPGAIVADNQFVSNGSVTGIHLQGGIDGSRVERNTIVWSAPCCGTAFGGIRARDGSGVVISGNVVRGPWLTSFFPVNLSSSLVEQNRLEGATAYGILGGGPAVGGFSIADNLFRANRITGAGAAGIFLRKACRNTLVGNDLQGNAGNLGLIFDVTTGANTFVGNQNDVIDNGAFDCTGDGVEDPNIITGRGAVLHGVNFGGIVSDEVASANRLR